MSQKNIIIGIIVLVVLIGGWFLLSHGTASPIVGDETTTGSPSDTDVAKAKTANDVQQLVTRGGNFTCTVTALAQNSNTTGAIYASNQSVRFDLSISSGGVTVTTHTIRSGGFAYAWVDGQSTGTKTVVSGSASVIPQPQGGVVSVDGQSNIASDCHPWIPDASKFAPPTNITFVAK